MRPRAAVALTGSTGAQQRLRYGLGEHKPYRWHGTPGWNPAAALHGWVSAGRSDRPCSECGARAGEKCRTKDGRPMARNTHVGR